MIMGHQEPALKVFFIFQSIKLDIMAKTFPKHKVLKKEVFFLPMLHRKVETGETGGVCGHCLLLLCGNLTVHRECI